MRFFTSAPSDSRSVCVTTLTAALAAGLSVAVLDAGAPPDSSAARQVASSGAVRESGASGNSLVANVLLQFERRERIAASVLLQATLDGRKLEMGGPEFISRYYQKWDTNHEKLSVCCELRGHIDGTPVSWKQVSDGDRLWIDQQTANGRSISRIDLRQVCRELNSADSDAPPLPAGQAGVLPIQIDLLSERGGLPTLIAALRDNFHFSAPVSLRLGDDVPVYGTIGHWKPDKLSLLLPHIGADGSAATAIGEPPALPARIPASVMLLVGQDDLFPYIIEFRSSHATAPFAPGDMSQYRIRPQSLLLLHLYERSFSFEFDAGLFDFSPGEAEWVDLTASRLSRWRASREIRAVEDAAVPSPSR